MPKLREIWYRIRGSAPLHHLFGIDPEKVKDIKKRAERSYLFASKEHGRKGWVFGVEADRTRSAQQKMAYTVGKLEARVERRYWNIVSRYRNDERVNKLRQLLERPEENIDEIHRIVKELMSEIGHYTR